MLMAGTFVKAGSIYVDLKQVLKFENFNEEFFLKLGNDVGARVDKESYPEAYAQIEHWLNQRLMRPVKGAEPHEAVKASESGEQLSPGRSESIGRPS